MPAWKRLGLKLKKFDEAEPNHQTSEPQQQQQQQTSAREASPLQQDSVVDHTPKSKSHLGKRKHHSDTPDIQGGDSVKKSKRDRNNGLADGDAVAAPDVQSDAMATGASEAPSADTAPPKGDANYRKKKGGDSNYRKKKETKEPKPGKKTSHSNAQHLSAPAPLRTPSLSPGQTDLLPSTEVDHLAPAILATPQRQQGHFSKHNTLSVSPSKTDRRKSVTFTPDTKTSDGNSASNLFKKWVAEQKGSDADFTPAEVAQFTEPPKVHVANSNPPTSQVSTTLDPMSLILGNCIGMALHMQIFGLARNLNCLHSLNCCNHWPWLTYILASKERNPPHSRSQREEGPFAVSELSRSVLSGPGKLEI